MVNRATAAFVFSIIGAAYQIISPGMAALADGGTSAYYYIITFNSQLLTSLLLTSFVVIWSATHILEDWKGRITWPSIMLALGLVELWNIVLAYLTPNMVFRILSLPSNGTLSVAATLALVPGPLTIMIGGILGFWAVRQYSREHGHAVLGHA
jgi:hypothetical protein